MVDWDRICELRDEIGNDDYAEVIELFFLEVDEVIRRLALPGTDAEREADMHFLKGSAVNLGFTAFGGLCAAGERHAVEGTLDDAEVRAVIDCFHTTRHVFEAGTAAAA